MIIEKVGKVTRCHCPVCGEDYAVLGVSERDAIEHQHKTDRAGAWWILRRAAA